MKRVLFLLLILSCVRASSQLTVDSGKRYIKDGNGNPVLLSGMSSWALFTALTYNESKRYIDTLVSNKINYICVFMVSGTYVNSTATDFANIYGVLPFQSSQTFSSTPNEAYWAHIDSVLTYAQTKGVNVALFPDYLGYDGESTSIQGWGSQTTSCTAAQMKSYGQFVGQRYAGYNNIVWVIGGDCDPTWVKAKLDSLASGIKQYSSAPMSARDETGASLRTRWTGNAKFTVNYCYVYADGYEYASPSRDGGTSWGVQGGAANIGTYPFIWAEGRYWHEAPTGPVTTTYRYQHQIYLPILWGATGFIMGNCPLWSFGNFSGFTACNGLTWEDQLTGEHLTSIKHASSLFRNRNWWLIVPDTNNVALTAGMGSYSGYDSTLAYCGYTSDSTTIFVFPRNTAQLTVTSVKLRNRGTGNDSVYSWWYDTNSGTASWIGNETRASHTYTPANNHVVLVLDAKSAGFPPPGQDPPPPPPPEPTKHLRARRIG